MGGGGQKEDNWLFTILERKAGIWMNWAKLWAIQVSKLDKMKGH